MRKVKNFDEIKRIENLLRRDILCLSYSFIDAKKLTRNLINDIEIDDIESFLINEINDIMIMNLEKNPYNKNLVGYKIELLLECKDDNYLINDWFTLNKKEDVFCQSEIMEDQNYA